MKRSSAFALLSLLLLAAHLRLLPVTQYLYWGADFGEYFLISRLLAERAPLPEEYGGWGVGYPEFPGMNILVAALSWTGISLEASAVLLVPVLAALVVVPAYLIGREVTGKDWPALFAAAVVAVVFPTVYTTSHAIPGALGDLLLTSALLLFLRLRLDPRALTVLAIVAAALIFVHHLSSFFLLIIAFMMVFLRITLRGASMKDVRWEMGFLWAFAGGLLAYWALFAESFRGFLGVGRFPWWATALLLLALPASLHLVAWLRSRVAWSYMPAFPRPSRGVRLYLVVMAATAVLLAAFYFTTVPGTSVPISSISIVFALPVLYLFLPSAPGRRFMDFLPGGFAITGWFVALLLSLTLGGLLAPSFLIPYRHLQYITLPLALFAGVGAVHLMSGPRRWRRAFAASLVVAVVLGAATALPPREALGNHFEGTRPIGLLVVHWSGEYVSGVVATDHRISSMIFGLGGIRPTWDTVSLSLYAATFDEAKGEMAWVESLPGGAARIDYVVLDDDMVRGATLLPWDSALPLSEAALEKFLGGHYLKLYDDGYSQVYWVNWGTA